MALENPKALRAVALALVATLAGCSTLPRDGPSGSSVVQGSSRPGLTQNYVIYDLDYRASEAVKSQPFLSLETLTAGNSEDAAGIIGEGDTLSVSIFDPSGSLFGGGSGSGAGAGALTRSGNQTLPPLTVEPSGFISVPFAGRIRVTGLTPPEAASAVQRALASKTPNPQVLVSIAENSYNSVTVLGDIRQPGRTPLAVNADRLIDVIAARGGPARPSDDLQVVIRRGGETYRAPLSIVMSDMRENIRLSRGDEINLTYVPRRYSTFGAVGAISQSEIPAGELTLAGALSKAGGLDTNSANARSVLVFRFERPAVADALGITQPATPRGIPVVYRLNLEDATGLFVANNFQIQPDDLIYVPRSGSAELGKFFTLVQTVTRVVYDVSVTSTLSTR